MASSYPTSLDSFTDPTSGSSLASPSHSGQHIDLNDAVEKLETKLGIGSSPASSAVNGAVLVANGSGTTTYSARPVGLWKITPSSVVNASIGTLGRVTITTQTTASLNGIFSSDFLNYRVIFKMTACSAASNLLCKLRASGTDSSASYVWSAIVTGNTGASSVSTSGAGTSINPNFLNNTIPRGQSVSEWFGPYEVANTTFTFVDDFNDTVAQQMRSGGGIHTVNTAYDGLSWSVSSGTFSATVDVYGYN